MEVFKISFDAVLTPHLNTEKMVFDETFRGQEK